MKLTINEAITTLKTLRERHDELVQLRNLNSASETRFRGLAGDKTTERKPEYDVKKLDKLVSQVAMEIRKLDLAIKRGNASYVIPDYEWDEAVLGQVE